MLVIECENFDDSIKNFEFRVEPEKIRQSSELGFFLVSIHDLDIFGLFIQELPIKLYNVSSVYLYCFSQSVGLKVLDSTHP